MIPGVLSDVSRLLWTFPGVHLDICEGSSTRFQLILSTYLKLLEDDSTGFVWTLVEGHLTV